MADLKNRNIVITVVGSILYIATFLLLLGDSFYNPASSVKYFFVDSRFLYTLFVIIHIILTIFQKQFLNDSLIKVNKILIFPLASVIFITSALVNGFTYQGFIFNTLALNLEIFKYIFYISGFVFLANIKADWLKTFSERLLYLGGILFLMFITLFSSFYPEFYTTLLKEDGFFENTQVIFYFSAFVLSLQITYLLFKKSVNVPAIFFLVLSLGLFFITGEEVSWGQRFFHIQTPEELAKINLQGELTVHNIGAFQSKIDYIFMLLGLWGAFGSIVFKKIAPNLFKKYWLIFPPPLIFFYFFAVARYYFLNKFVVFNYQLFSFEKVGIGDRQELSETLLAFGFLCFALLTYNLVRSKSFGVKMANENT